MNTGLYRRRTFGRRKTRGRCPLEREDDGNTTARHMEAALSRLIVRCSTRKGAEREGQSAAAFKARRGGC